MSNYSEDQSTRGENRAICTTRRDRSDGLHFRRQSDQLESSPPGELHSSKLIVRHPVLFHGSSLNGLCNTDHYRQTERVRIFQTAVSAFFREAMSDGERGDNYGAGRHRGLPPPLTTQAYHPITVPVLPPAPAPAPAPPPPPSRHYCCSPGSRLVIFCGLRKSLREILSSKHTSSMYSLVPMMYSQADLFYSPRSKRNDSEGDMGQSATTLGGGVSSAWKGLKIAVTPNPKAHLHFNSAVRQAVEKYSDVLSSMKCHHMDDIIKEVMRLCPLLRNEVTVKNKVRRAVKSYICNAVTHYKRKQRNKVLGYSSTSHGSGSASRVHGPDHSEAHSPDVEDFFGGDSSSSYQDELIDYSNAGHAAHASVTMGSVSPQENAVVYDQGPAPTSTIHRRLSASSAESCPQTDSVSDSERSQPSVAIAKSELGPDRQLQITEVRTIMDVDGDSCVASSGAKDEKGFQFSEGPSMEELRAVQADFAKQRDWDQFHQPRNLLLAMIGEVGEVSELFQWRGECKEGLEDWSEKDKKHLGQELSDVLMYLIRLAEKCHVDLPRAAMEKVGLNAKKYPAQKVYGSSKKYTEYD
ncbi:uncharacterized protein LOC119730396 [Patiria miniata]|uniref:dCTP pyrophosphatase 1 n=1 Tax=Patiria miniata TaxID=46514 RepID=A0A914A5Q9_PATMI|nr:uncharacterized protein LOC119730396 [Patiria miniata]